MKSPYSMEQLKSLSAPEWSDIKGKQLRQTYQQIKEIYHKRAKAFAKHGEAKHAYKLPSAKGLSEGQMRSILKEALRGTDYARRTYEGFSKAESIRKSKIESIMKERYGIEFKTREEWEQFDKFLEEMEQQYGAMHRYLSGTAAKIYSQAMRIGVDPRQMMKNYDYWEAHIKDLYKAEPIRRRSETPAEPSYLARKLGLEKIRSWNKEHAELLAAQED